MDEIFKQLTYTLQEKTKCILDTKRIYDDYLKQKKSANQSYKYLYLLVMCLMIFILIISIYDVVSIDVIIELIEGKSIRFGLRFWLIFCITLTIIVYCIIRYNKTSKLETDLENDIEITKKDYEKLRLEIIDSLDSEFCNHELRCDCKEQYIKMMKMNNIELVFREKPSSFVD